MNISELQADLAKVAAEYNHSVLQQAVLDNYKDSILLLRSKYASYERIAEILGDHGIKVSVATVRKFCRRHYAETQRLRAEITAEMTATSTVPAAPVADPRPSLTGDPGRRGARPARDNF